MNKSVKTGILSFLGAMVMAWLGNYFYDQTKNIPVLSVITSFFNWIYDTGLRFLNLRIKVWVILIASFGMFLLYKWFKHITTDKTPPDFTNYRKDVLKKWIWRWDWKFTNEGWTIVNLTPYCPKDDVQLIENGSFLSRSYYCPKCNTQFGEYREPVEHKADAHVLILDKVNKRTYPT